MFPIDLNPASLVSIDKRTLVACFVLISHPHDVRSISEHAGILRSGRLKMFWFIVPPVIITISLLCASLCVVASDSDEMIEDLNRFASRTRSLGTH